MTLREPRTQTIDLTDAEQRWSQLVEGVSKSRTRVIVEQGGRPVAAIISAEDLERFKRLEAERERDFAILDEIGEAFKDVPAEEIEREVAKAIAEIREEDRRQHQRSGRP